MQRVCSKCGIVHGGYGDLCQTCRKYERNGGVWHPLPPRGTVHYDNDGKPICHICGMAHDKLMEHVRRKHHLTNAEYRERFGLMRKLARLTSPKYSVKMRNHVDDVPTWRNNFAAVHSGEMPVGRRRIRKWSAQETEARRKAQSKISRCRRIFKPKTHK